MAKKSSTYKRTKKAPKWQVPLLLILVLVAVGFGVFIVFFSRAGSTSPQVYLTNSNTNSMATIPNSGGFTYGTTGDKIIACDWDGTGGATVAAYRPSNSNFYISNTNAAGSASVTPFQFGNANSFDQPFCGTWAFGAKPTVGIFRDGTFYLASSNTAGTSSTPVSNIGALPGDIPLACDWNGDGRTDLGYYRPSNANFYMAFDYGGWKMFRNFQFGDPNSGDYPVCGNWDGSGLDNANFTYDTVGVYRAKDAKFYLRNSNTAGPADVPTATSYGTPSDKFVPVVGNWYGGKQTLIGAYRPGVVETAPTATTTSTSTATGSTATPQQPDPCPTNVDYSTNIRQLQICVKSKGASIAVDGILGNQTRDACIKYPPPGGCPTRIVDYGKGVGGSGGSGGSNTLPSLKGITESFRDISGTNISTVCNNYNIILMNAAANYDNNVKLYDKVWPGTTGIWRSSYPSSFQYTQELLKLKNLGIYCGTANLTAINTNFVKYNESRNKLNNWTTILNALPPLGPGFQLQGTR